ncbi:hypothetical protein ACQ4PT_067681 [Festuca glaucescens]
MANFPVDPTPFIPGQFEILEVPNRPQQCRYHVTGQVSAKHEDVAIATITPGFPDNQLFAATRLFLRSFIEDELHFSLDITQCCPIGSAYVRVSSTADRDCLVSRSPHHFQGHAITFIEHNRGLNHRAFTYNRECWLMLLAFPSDFWADEHIRGAIKDFGALISWDKEASSYGALVAKVRVVDLQHIPHSCVVSSGNEWAAESWSVPVFILSQKLIGGLPADEELPPADRSTPHPMPNMAFQMPAGEDVVDVPVQQANHDWPLWQPAQPHAHGLNVDAGPPLNFIGQNLNFVGVGLDLNDVLHNIAIDLNAAPHQLNEDDFLELNDLINPVIHNNGQAPVIFSLPAPNLLQQAPADVDMMEVEEIHSDLTVTISSANTLSDESDDSVNGAPLILQQQNLNIGMALMPEFHIDPVAQMSTQYASENASFYFSKEGTSAWSSHFKPDGSIVNTVTVPAQ